MKTPWQDKLRAWQHENKDANVSLTLQILDTLCTFDELHEKAEATARAVYETLTDQRATTDLNDKQF